MTSIAKRRQLTGTVISTKMAKTIVVKVDRTKLHQRYGKRFTVSKKYQVHDETSQCRMGDRVVFEECRPLSRHKCWRLIKRLTVTE